MTKDTDTTESADISVSNNDLLGEWIPINKTQPEWDAYVLVCKPSYSGKPISIGKLKQIDAKGYGFYLGDAVMDTGLNYDCEYWMPLPPSPNMKEQ